MLLKLEVAEIILASRIIEQYNLYSVKNMLLRPSGSYALARSEEALIQSEEVYRCPSAG